MRIPPVKIVFSDADRRKVLAQMDEVLRSGYLTLGRFGREFEEKFADYIGARHAVAVNSGTSSLEIPLRILGIEGREVIVPTNTFFATPAAVLHAGGRVRFADVERETFALGPETMLAALTPDTVGVIVVHIGGLVSPKMAEIRRLCDERGLFLLEDAAHAHGSSQNGRRAGTFGQVASFSFYPTKVMTSAEGGMIVTNDDRMRQEALIYRDQGKAGFLTNLHTRLGYNWRMSEPHAIIGLAQFERLEEFIAHRIHIAQIYDEGLQSIPWATPLGVPLGGRCNYYKYIVLLPPGTDRVSLKKLLRQEYEVALSGEVYDTPCHLQPIFGPHHARECPVAEDVCSRHICLPISAAMSDEEANYVVDSLKDAMGRRAVC